MRVRTTRKHYNNHGDKYEKNLGKQYDVTDAEGRRLIGMGYVEEVKPAAEDDEG